jgi:hypothetical protein
MPYASPSGGKGARLAILEELDQLVIGPERTFASS